MKNHTIAIKGYIACLGLWNEGIDRGRWIDFPIDSDELTEVLTAIGCNAENEEYFFPDWESPVKLGEYESVDHVNDIAERLDEIDEDDDIIQAILTNTITTLSVACQSSRMATIPFTIIVTAWKM